MEHLDPKGTILRVVYSGSPDWGAFYAAYYIRDGNTDPPTELILEASSGSPTTAGADMLDDLQETWTALHP